MDIVVVGSGDGSGSVLRLGGPREAVNGRARLSAVAGAGVYAAGAGTDAPYAGEPQRVDDLAALVAEIEATEQPCWIFADTRAVYPRLLRSGVRIGRGRDVRLTEAALVARAGDFGAPCGLAAAEARLRGESPAPDPRRPPDNPSSGAEHGQPALFGLTEPTDRRAVARVHAAQQAALECDSAGLECDSTGLGRDAATLGRDSMPRGNASSGNETEHPQPSTPASAMTPTYDPACTVPYNPAGAYGGAPAYNPAPAHEPAPAYDPTARAPAPAHEAAPGRRSAPAHRPAPAYEPAPVTVRQLRLLAATDGAAALAAAEMSHHGLPWSAEIHDRILTEALGPRPTGSGRPARLQQLADAIGAALDSPGLNPDSPSAVIQAFTRAGIALDSTRAHRLRRVEHPAIPLLLDYKGRSRLFAANGWAWLEQWVSGGRFRPAYEPAAVVSGRWATSGGGALQIPRAVRAAAVAEPGWRLVVADARQLEPRVLAALSRDPAMAAAAGENDMYAGLATEAFGGDRAAAKVGLIAAMYGASGAGLARLRGSYPVALAMLEAAARTGEGGGLVRSVLGRTSPWPGATFGTAAERILADENDDGRGLGGDLTEHDDRRGLGGDPAEHAHGGDDTDPISAADGSAVGALAAARAWGRFTRNFIIQASAADWAAVLLALVRSRLPEPVELVYFCHDEIVAHAPEELADPVARIIADAAPEATRLVFGHDTVRLPMAIAVVPAYADAK